MVSAEDWAILATSFGVAGWAVAGSLPLALLAAWALSRRPFPGKSVLEAVVHLPLVLPPVLVGFALLTVFGRTGPVGGLLDDWFGVRLAFTAQGAALATAVMTFPLLVRALRLTFDSINPAIMEAAATLRAGPMDRLVSVIAPLAAPGALAAGATAFAAGLGEFGAVITFAANIEGETQTLPIAIYAALQQPDGDARAWRLAGYAFALALAGLAFGEALYAIARRRLGR